MRAFQVMAKPVGRRCNLACDYCFYRERSGRRTSGEPRRMSDEVLEAYVRQYIEGQDVAEVSFAWQGGEPTLAGLGFFRRAVALQARYAGGRRISNAIQTNGTPLDDAWCAFFSRHGFLVGLSLDGPPHLHDAYRSGTRGEPTFQAVMRGLELLKKHGTDFNTLTAVNRKNAREPLAVYRFLTEAGSRFLQFIPVVERLADDTGERDEHLASPPDLEGAERALPLAPWSVDGEALGTFLVEIFDHWVRRDVGRCFVRIFDATLGNWLRAPAGLCMLAPTCGDAMVLEHDGSLYSCDHYVYPPYKLGNILDRPLAELAGSEQQRRFGQCKASLPGQCRECEVRFACHGECPKRRFARTGHAGEPGLNHLCAGYRRFFNHAAPHMATMARLVRRGQPAARIMSLHDRDRS